MSKKAPAIITTVRFPTDMHAEMIAASEETFVSQNTFILQAVAEKLKRSNWLDDKKDLDDGK